MDETDDVFILADLDEFFVQVERDAARHRRRPLASAAAADRPPPPALVVQQHQDIVAVGWDARALGVAKHMTPKHVRETWGARIELVHVPTLSRPDAPDVTKARSGGSRRKSIAS
jgi:hypothetical protein